MTPENSFPDTLIKLCLSIHNIKRQLRLQHLYEPLPGHFPICWRLSVPELQFATFTRTARRQTYCERSIREIARASTRDFLRVQP